MPRTLYYGSRGEDVAALQKALNASAPTRLPLLVVDGAFGPKTLARVKEFQGNRKLVVDGIAGPKTWGALSAESPPKIAHRRGSDCGTADPGNRAIGSMITRRFVGTRTATGLSSFAAGDTTQTHAFGAGSNPFRMLTDVQKSKARAVFTNSLDFSRIFLSEKTGIGGRPFTIAFPDENEVVQIMNCGTFDPSDRLLIHELTHVWQSQHHNNPYKFMANAVDCQAGAVTANVAEVLSNPDVLLHKDYPAQFPFSAYAYMPGLPFSEYAAEQMANAVELGEKDVRAHVRSITINTVDGANVTALTKVAFSDRRRSGIKY